MSTRSYIIVQHIDGAFASIYCHSDGYPSHNGNMLLTHYNSQKKAEGLVRLGDMSFMDAKNTKPKGHSFDNRVEGYSVYYHRDRNEAWDNMKPKVGTLKDVAPGEDSWIEYVYVWQLQEKAWFLADVNGENLQPLAPIVEAEVKKDAEERAKRQAAYDEKKAA